MGTTIVIAGSEVRLGSVVELPKQIVHRNPSKDSLLCSYK